MEAQFSTCDLYDSQHTPCRSTIMPLSLYDASVPVFKQMLGGLDAVLGKSQDLAAARSCDLPRTASRPPSICLNTGTEASYRESGMIVDLHGVCCESYRSHVENCASITFSLDAVSYTHL